MKHPIHGPRRRHCGTRAFTLIELLTVVAIIGILAAILLPCVDSVRQSAKASTCASNLRQIATAIQTFAADNQGRFPGKGRVSSSASASWQDVINARVFGSGLGANRPTLQRLGDTPNPGQIYCPSMEPFGDTARYPRAYLLNANTVDSNTGSNPPADWGDLLDYQKGQPVNIFSVPARTLLVVESERSGDNAQPFSPLNQIVMDDGSSQPSWSANSGSYAFRHRNRMNVLFVDGHIETLGPSECAKYNNSAGYTPAGI